MKDGWGEYLKIRNDFNISEENRASFLTLLSSGADKKEESELSLVKKEFDLTKENASLQEIYSEDINQTYEKSRFIIQSLDIDLTLKEEANESGAVAILIYSPMLYYLEGAGCSELNTTHGECEGVEKAYKPYLEDIGDISDKSFHVGIMKIELYFNQEGESRLFINKEGILESEEAYDFESGEYNLTATRFFNAFSAKTDEGWVSDWAFESAPKDDQNPFYFFGGTKAVSVWFKDSEGWKENGSFVTDFKPGRRYKVQ